jgi:hypothetical protein
MPLARKITKATFDTLNDVIKAEYKEKDGSYFLDTDDASGLESALERQKEENANLKRDLATFRTELDTIRNERETAVADKNRKNKDYEALEASYNEKIAAKEAEGKKREEALQAKLKTILVDNKALELANEIFGENADIGLPHIKHRLAAEFEGENATTRILDKEGKPTASSFDDFKKEFLDNPRFASIVVGSRASGGNANGNGANGNAGNKKPQDMNSAERNELFAKNPEAFYQAFPQARPVV